MDRFWFSVIRPCLSFIGARVIAEIGTGKGDTAVLAADFCREHGARFHTIDTAPALDVRVFEETHAPYITCYRGRSLDILPHIPTYDAILIDGDHNWYSVFHELELVERRRRETDVQCMVFLHDTGWPYGRRDLYYDITLIPEEFRQESEVAGIDPATDTLSPVGFNARLRHAKKAGGDRNGVLTAVEDFLRSHLDWQIVTVPGFFGLSILIPQPLLDAYPDFLRFLELIVPSEEMEEHLKEIEADRIVHLALSQSVRKTNDALLTQLEEKNIHIRELSEAKKTDPAEEQAIAQLRHMESTLSWKITAPLRIAGALLRRDLSVYSDMWVRMGRPFPRTMRFLRHRLLGAFLPATVVSIPQQMVSDTAVIVVCPETAMYLPDTLDSLLNQSRRPADILVVRTSDVRDDVTGVLLPYLDKGVRFLQSGFTTALAAARAGISATTSGFIVFMESGDLLHRDFVECNELLLLENPSTGIAMSDVRLFGAQRGYRRAPDTADTHAPLSMESRPRNGIMIRREALEQARGWPMDQKQSVWNEILQLGFRVQRSMGLYLKRATATDIFADSAPHNALLPATLCLSLSGRSWAWPLTSSFLETQTYPHALIHLVIVDTADDAAFSAVVRRWLSSCDYRSVTYKTLRTGQKGLADLPRETVAKDVSIACSAIYNTFARTIDTPLVFTLEDDVIPPQDAFVHLSTLMTGDVLSASALYWHRDKKQPVCWIWDRGGPAFPEKGHGVQEIGGTGFGCLAIRGDVFRSTVFQSGQPFGNYDHNFFALHTLKDSRTAVIDWDCVCRHYQSPDVWF